MLYAAIGILQKNLEYVKSLFNISGFQNFAVLAMQFITRVRQLQRPVYKE
jgi:hypothetical protein